MRRRSDAEDRLSGFNAMVAASGALTGLIVGLTGVGGGALMTPVLLLFFGVAPTTAVGTDLWFAAITKLAITRIHHRNQLIEWEVVRRLASGSLIASAATLVWMRAWPVAAGRVELIRAGIAVAVCVTAVGLFAQPLLIAAGRRAGFGSPERINKWQGPLTIAAGIVLGVLVTLTSVGAGALGVVFLVGLYPTRLTPPRLVATDVAHALMLAVFAGLGHLFESNVDGRLLINLLIGSIPAAVLGAALSSRLPHRALRWALALVLLIIGVKLAIDTF